MEAKDFADVRHEVGAHLTDGEPTQEFSPEELWMEHRGVGYTAVEQAAKLRAMADQLDPLSPVRKAKAEVSVILDGVVQFVAVVDVEPDKQTVFNAEHTPWTLIVRGA